MSLCQENWEISTGQHLQLLGEDTEDSRKQMDPLKFKTKNIFSLLGFCLTSRQDRWFSRPGFNSQHSQGSWEPDLRNMLPSSGFWRLCMHMETTPYTQNENQSFYDMAIYSLKWHWTSEPHVSTFQMLGFQACNSIPKGAIVLKTVLWSLALHHEKS